MKLKMKKKSRSVPPKGAAAQDSPTPPTEKEAGAPYETGKNRAPSLCGALKKGQTLIPETPESLIAPNTRGHRGAPDSGPKTVAVAG
jgi:hypothetical protein